MRIAKSAENFQEFVMSFLPYLVMAMAMSFRCNVRLLFCSVCTQALKVNSCMNISAALANSSGASADIIFTSSSSFMIFLIRASGSS
jgi:hypothetical protein